LNEQLKEYIEKSKNLRKATLVQAGSIEPILKEIKQGT
jgi:hypothetical protein